MFQNREGFFLSKASLNIFHYPTIISDFYIHEIYFSTSLRIRTPNAMTSITRIFLALTSLHVLCCQAGVIEYLFGSTDAICYNTTKVEFEKVCEPFKKRTCYTENSETCAPVEYKNCTGVVETKAERACFNVSEIFCDLHESIHLEHIEETYQLMHCFVAVDRVCDTVYRIETKTEDEYHCIDVEAPKCFQRVYTINDISCTDSVEFNCQSFDFDWMSKGGGRDVICARFPRKQCHKVPRKVGNPNEP